MQQRNLVFPIVVALETFRASSQIIIRSIVLSINYILITIVQLGISFFLSLKLLDYQQHNPFLSIPALI